MTLILQQIIGSECQLTFPPQLQAFADEIKRSGLQEDEFVQRVRQSFLAFTIIVSHMSYICMEGIVLKEGDNDQSQSTGIPVAA